MDPVTAVALFWGACTLATLGLTLATRRQTGGHPAIVATAMCIIWAASKIIRWHSGVGVMLAAYPFEDAMVGLTALFLYVRRPETWKAMVAFVLLVRIGDHLANHAVVAAALSHVQTASLDDYILGVNLLFGVVLVCIAGRGAIVVGLAVARWGFSYPRMRSRRLSAVREGVAPRQGVWR